MEVERESHLVSISSLRLKTTAPKEIKNELRTIKRKNGWSWRIIPVAVFIITIGWGPGAESQLSQDISTGHSTTLET